MEYITLDKIGATGTGAISLSYAPGFRFLLDYVTVRFNTAPSTSENLTVTLDSGRGAVYDTVLYSVNPATEAATNFFFHPDRELPLDRDDAV